MSDNKFILGVCGYIGSGKSEVLSVLEDEGWFVIDADKVVHDLYKPDASGQRKISDFFGNEFLRSDGSVNRSKLRKVVFEDVKKLKILNALIHPLVFSEIGRILDGVENDRVAIEAVYFEEKYGRNNNNKGIPYETAHQYSPTPPDSNPDTPITSSDK